MDRISRLEQRVVHVEASITTSQTNTTSAIGTLKADLEKRMTLQESKTDANTDVLQKIWSKVSGSDNQPATYPQASGQQQPQQQTWSQQPQVQVLQPTWPVQAQSYYRPAPKGKGGGGKGGKGKGPCWTCKQWGHIARNCPNHHPTSNAYVGSA